MLCAFKNASGDTCGAHAMTDSIYCFSHNPEAKEDKLEAVTKGGRAIKVKAESQVLPPMSAVTIPEIREVIQDTVNRMRTDPLTHQSANSIGYLLNISIRAIEVGEIENRLKEIEEKLL